MRRCHTVRPSTRHALVFITVVIALLVWIVGELGRTHAGRVVLAALSVIVFAFFAVGWATR